MIFIFWRELFAYDFIDWLPFSFVSQWFCCYPRIKKNSHFESVKVKRIFKSPFLVEKRSNFWVTTGGTTVTSDTPGEITVPSSTSTAFCNWRDVNLVTRVPVFFLFSFSGTTCENVLWSENCPFASLFLNLELFSHGYLWNLWKWPFVSSGRRGFLGIRTNVVFCSFFRLFYCNLTTQRTNSQLEHLSENMTRRNKIQHWKRDGSVFNNFCPVLNTFSINHILLRTWRRLRYVLSDRFLFLLPTSWLSTYLTDDTFGP